MALDDNQKAELIRRFTPVLFLKMGGDDLPVRPEAFLRRSALWSAVVPYDNKMLWGQGDNVTREPLIPRGNINLDPLDPMLLEEGVELWLETEGWARDNKVEPFTDNRTCTPTNPFQPGIETPWFYAEVSDFSTILNWFEFQPAQQGLGLNYAEFQELASSLIWICYYFLFPRHIENGTLARADGSLEPSGNYEGDWTCYAVIARESAAPNFIETPLFAGFSRRRRGASADFGTENLQEYMAIIPWEQVPSTEEHAGVKVALGTHNLYPLNSQQGEPGGVNPQWFDFGQSVSEPANNFVGSAVESPAGHASSAVTLAKMLTGLAIAGPIGALVGAAAGAAEATSIHEEIGEEPELEPGEGAGPDYGDLEDPRDGFQDDADTQAIVPLGQDHLVAALTGSPDGAAQISYWLDDGLETVVDRSRQGFWSDQLGGAHGFNGRWGVRCSDDPYNRRAGGQFPEFRLQILKQLVALL